MCRIHFAILAILLGGGQRPRQRAEVWTALPAGRHVVLMRHTDAPGGAGDPAAFRLDDCATQRQGTHGRRNQLRDFGSVAHAKQSFPTLSFFAVLSTRVKRLQIHGVTGYVGDYELSGSFSERVSKRQKGILRSIDREARWPLHA
jgi:hypothetical protein